MKCVVVRGSGSVSVTLLNLGKVEITVLVTVGSNKLVMSVTPQTP